MNNEQKSMIMCWQTICTAIQTLSFPTTAISMAIPPPGIQLYGLAWGERVSCLRSSAWDQDNVKSDQISCHYHKNSLKWTSSTVTLTIITNKSTEMNFHYTVTLCHYHIQIRWIRPAVQWLLPLSHTNSLKWTSSTLYLLLAIIT